MKQIMTNELDWDETRDPAELSAQNPARTIVSIGDSYLSYAVILPTGMTVEQAEDSFVETYDFHETGSPEALRREMTTRVYRTGEETRRR
jgi:hypothetical protein